MITIDILSPVGGRTGGIENVIRAWTRKLPGDEYDIRVIHMAPGMKYLEGYNKHIHLPNVWMITLIQSLHILQEIMQDL